MAWQRRRGRELRRRRSSTCRLSTWREVLCNVIEWGRSGVVYQITISAEMRRERAYEMHMGFDVPDQSRCPLVFSGSVPVVSPYVLHFHRITIPAAHFSIKYCFFLISSSLNPSNRQREKEAILEPPLRERMLFFISSERERETLWGREIEREEIENRQIRKGGLRR